MYTSHGHHIAGTVKETGRPHVVARCGGPGMCHPCSEEAHMVQTIPSALVEFHNEQTLDKVRAALIRAVGKNLTHDCIRELQNEGILFRERVRTDGGTVQE